MASTTNAYAGKERPGRHKVLKWGSGAGELFADGSQRYEGLSRRRVPNGARDVTGPSVEEEVKPRYHVSSESCIAEERPDERSLANEQLLVSLGDDADLCAPERKRIARDLHDHAGQYFVGIMLRLAALELLATDCHLRESLRELHATVIRFRDDLRAICAGQQCGVPRGNALMTALAHLIPQWEQEVGIAARLDQDVEGSGEFDDATAEAVFRVVQEALTNVAKHASQASQVNISLHLKPQLGRRMLTLEIEDDGLAKAAPEKSSRSGMEPCSGIAGMRERVAEVGGSFEVRQQMGKGTSVVAMIPID